MLLFEREAAFAQMRELSAGRRETPRVGLVSGAAGTGKTAMLRVYSRVAREDFGCQVLTASCSADERELSLGLIMQLLDHDLVPPESRECIAYAADRAAEAGDPADRDFALVPAVAHLAQETLGILKSLAVAAPVILCVDDVHHADAASLQVLLYLLRRLPSGRFVLFVTDAPHVEHSLPQFRQELARRSCYYPMPLDVLTEDGVQQWLSVQLDEKAAGQLAPEFLTASGGNPLLLGALIDDVLTAPAGRVAVGQGDAFRGAALSILSRLGAAVREVAHAAAVLGDETSPVAVANLLGCPVDAVVPGIAALTACGMFGENGYRHAALSDAVASAIPPADRAAAHLRAAQVAHDHGADALAVAEHFVAAGTVPAPWAVRVLLDAAAQAEAARRSELAVSCLDLVREHCPDPALRARTTMSLARLEWRTEPSSASRHFEELTAAAHARYLELGDVVMVVRWMLWLGRHDEAADLAGQELGTTAAADDSVLAVVEVLGRWYPGYAAGGMTAVAATGRPGAGHFEPAVTTAAATLESALTEGSTERNLGRAERVLVGAELDDASLPTLVCALEALIHSDQHAAAIGWCESFLRDAGGRRAATWEALLAAVRASAALHGGDLLDARKWATFALGRISRRSWGVMVGLPISVLLRALVGLSQFDDAATLVREVVPEQAYDCIYGLRLLRARGEYFLATRRLHDAQAAFERWGERAEAWGCDLPLREPWRVALAQIHLAFDDPAAARELAVAQLARPGGSAPRPRATALRVIAAASDVRRRPAVLREAVDLFQAAGDRTQQAAAMTELARAHTGLGEFNRARLLTRRALEVAAESGSEQMCRVLLAGGPANAAEPADAVDDHDADETLDVLSDAERRVAELAVMGNTNREIGAKLFITVSTVEQHLTRIYRKLGVTRRADLPLRLPTRARASAYAPAASA